uniref:ATP-binding cassette domain-containing protein n=1 Tax=Hugonella massiliensis TaxID=1720315 RepID=UPI00073EE06A|nr:ATP-binding cassette domain-containing protein [Hugonella massiliensis]
MQLNLNHISYTYPGTVSAAIDDVSVTFPSGWTGIIGDNGCGKSTLARIAVHSIAPDSGTVSPKLFSAYCQQDSTQEPDNLFDLASDWGKEAHEQGLCFASKTTGSGAMALYLAVSRSDSRSHARSMRDRKSSSWTSRQTTSTS